ncbi:MAG: DUF547 domain-containing protein [Tagaea sp.]
MRRRAILTAAVAAFLPGTVMAAPKAEPWPRWAAHDPHATHDVDHSAWDALLIRHRKDAADGIARFDYDALAASPEDRAALGAYLTALAGIAISRYARDAQMAFWIDLYNALTVDIVVRHWPVASIRDIRISPGWFSVGPWGRKAVAVEGEELSLDDIEHRILRPLWNDPRVHYAVNCASLGCPNLPPRAVTAANLEAVLARGAAEFVAHPRAFRIDGGRLRVSSIYEWFKADFGGTDAGVIAHLRAHAAPARADALAGFARIDGHDYDWSINRARGSAL